MTVNNRFNPFSNQVQESSLESLSTFSQDTSNKGFVEDAINDELTTLNDSFDIVAPSNICYKNSLQDYQQRLAILNIFLPFLSNKIKNMVTCEKETYEKFKELRDRIKACSAYEIKDKKTTLFLEIQQQILLNKVDTIKKLEEMNEYYPHLLSYFISTSTLLKLIDFYKNDETNLKPILSKITLMAYAKLTYKNEDEFNQIQSFFQANFYALFNNTAEKTNNLTLAIWNTFLNNSRRTYQSIPKEQMKIACINYDLDTCFLNTIIHYLISLPLEDRLSYLLHVNEQAPFHSYSMIKLFSLISENNNNNENCLLKTIFFTIHPASKEKIIDPLSYLSFYLSIPGVISRNLQAHIQTAIDKDTNPLRIAIVEKLKMTNRLYYKHWYFSSVLTYPEFVELITFKTDDNFYKSYFLIEDVCGYSPIFLASDNLLNALKEKYSGIFLDLIKESFAKMNKRTKTKFEEKVNNTKKTILSETNRKFLLYHLYTLEDLCQLDNNKVDSK